MLINIVYKCFYKNNLEKYYIPYHIHYLQILIYKFNI